MSKLDELVNELRDCAELADKNTEDYDFTAKTHRAYAKALHAFVKEFEEITENSINPKRPGLGKLLQKLPDNASVHFLADGKSVYVNARDLNCGRWITEFETIAALKEYLMTLPESESAK